MSNIQDITSHSPEEDSVYFLDCVVLLYLFHPQGDYNRNITAEYSRLYGQIIKKNKIIYNRTLVSELINRYLRLGYDYYIKEHNAIIVTHDSDFMYIKEDIQIITANTHMFK